MRLINIKLSYFIAVTLLRAGFLFVILLMYIRILL